MSDEKIFEIRIAKVATMPKPIQTRVVKEVSKMGEKKVNYKGYAKITYVTSSPRRIKSIEPIEGTSINYFKKQGKKFNISSAF
jgi:hypothetical protein